MIIVEVKLRDQGGMVEVKDVEFIKSIRNE